jgi:transposase
MWEAPVKNYRTSVGFDVHARSVVACRLDGETGEVFERRLTPDHRAILEWMRGLPGPVAVTYEAGPTGFVLARLLLTAGIVCVVAAPSKLRRPSGDRVKADTRDARHPARLLHLGEIVEVTIPSIEQEAARDLVRAREDVRGDLMSARHRVSKLLLRQGIVYSGGKAWTGKTRTVATHAVPSAARPPARRDHRDVNLKSPVGQHCCPKASQHPAGIGLAGRLDDAGDHQISKHPIINHVEAQPVIHGTDHVVEQP